VTTTFKRNPLCIWCSACVVVCKSAFVGGLFMGDEQYYIAQQFSACKQIRGAIHDRMHAVLLMWMLCLGEFRSISIYERKSGFVKNYNFFYRSPKCVSDAWAFECLSNQKPTTRNRRYWCYATSQWDSCVRIVLSLLVWACVFSGTTWINDWEGQKSSLTFWTLFENGCCSLDGCNFNFSCDNGTVPTGL